MDFEFIDWSLLFILALLVVTLHADFGAEVSKANHQGVRSIAASPCPNGGRQGEAAESLPFDYKYCGLSRV